MPTAPVCVQLEVQAQGQGSFLLDLEETEIQHMSWWQGVGNGLEYRMYYTGSQWALEQTQTSGETLTLLSKEETASEIPEDGIYESDVVDLSFTFVCHVPHYCDYMLLTNDDTDEEDVFEIQDDRINDEYWWSGSSGTISYNAGRWVVQEASGVEFSSSMYESDFPQDGDYQAASGDIPVKNFVFTCSEEEPDADDEDVCDETCMSPATISALQARADDNALIISQLQADFLTLQTGLTGWIETLRDSEETKASMETCFKGYLQERPGDYVYTTTTLEPTDATEEPTEAPYWEELPQLENFRCEGTGKTGGPRTFQLELQSVENCAWRCLNDAECEYFSVREDWNLCEGCAIEPALPTADFQSYAILDTRRALGEEDLMSLMEENAVLKEALHLQMADF